MESNLIWLAIIVLISYTTQAMSGFGSTILALTLGVHLYPIDVLLPVLVPLDMLVNLYIVIRHSRHVSRPHLFRSILPAMGIGVLAGIIAFQHIEGDLLKKLFGILVILLATRELYRQLQKRNDQIALSNLTAKAYVVGAGIVHGIYASGGPLLIYAVSRLNLPKSVFRSTLGAVWLIFSVILTASYLIAGKFTAHSIRLILVLLPMILIGILLGEWLHHRIDEKRFRIFVFTVLFFAGLSICIG
ncbi:hypothetical protein D1BOALGB6SA_4314 [Olavius sp. associated proteobacterium Delta 1]|nr:hypothetical protein D1BOALGB6SA_4314 [Olavius sp. associated proteobacterium Delta 1]